MRIILNKKKFYFLIITLINVNKITFKLIIILFIFINFLLIKNRMERTQLI